MAKNKYAELDKDALVAEIKARRTAGRKIAVDLRANEDNLRAALDTDDVENGDFDPETVEAPKDAKELSRTELAQGAIARADGVLAREVPTDLNEYKGKYKYRRDGEFKGEVFGLKIVPDNEVRAHKTHHAKSPRGFWDGTEAEFRDQFDKL